MAVVHHRTLQLDALEIFYREAGPENGPVLLAPHGYPCSSYEFRNLAALLGDRFRVVAPDFPGCGYSGTPDDFTYDFDGFAAFLLRFADALKLERFVLYLHDFGSQIGLRAAIAQPDRIIGLIIQNGDIYEDTLGPGYDPLKAYWADPTPEAKAKLGEAITLDGYRHEFMNGSEAVQDRLSPDLWTLHWALTNGRRRAIHLDVIAGLMENRTWFDRYQAYLREHRPPTMILWGPNDSYMPAEAGRAYLRDLPEAELHMFDGGGHWLLETHLDEAAPLIADFLAQVPDETR